MTSFVAPLTRAEIDTEIARAVRDGQSMSESLLALENHPGHELLRAYPQTGRTAQEWADVRQLVAGLWEDLARYSSVVDSAVTLRARRDKPNDQDLAQLTELLRGRPVDLGPTPVPISQRSLTGPSATENRIGLAGLTARMNVAFERAGDLVATVDDVATKIRQGLDPLHQQLAALRKAAGELPAAVGDELDRIDTALLDLSRRSVSDGLSITDPAAEVGVIGAQCRRVSDELAHLRTVQSDWQSAVSALRDQAVEVGRIQQRGRAARAEVAHTIVSGPLPAESDRLAELNDSIAALEGVAGWPARAAALKRTQALAATALSTARADAELAAGLLARRDELKGRLLAYRSKARRLGRATLPEAVSSYEKAATALAAIPCDLAASTRAVAAYSDVVREEKTGGKS